MIGQFKEEEKPEWLFIENVKNLLSVNRGWDFARLLTELDKAGYDAEWEVLNSKDFGVPQNRERCFIIGHLRSRGRRKVFPLRESNDEIAQLQGYEGVQILSNAITDTSKQRPGIFPISGGGTSRSMDSTDNKREQEKRMESNEP